jgi:glycosyltransferase involved in cell wall biosynthesis
MRRIEESQSAPNRDVEPCLALHLSSRRLLRIAVVPAYNEEQMVGATLESLACLADAIIVVNDGSHDSTRAKVLAWSTAYGRSLYLLDLPRNTGMAGALGVGFAQALLLMEQGDISPDDLLINVDADGQHQLDAIPEMCCLLEKSGYDMVLARRDLSGYPWIKRVGNWVMSAVGSLFAGYCYQDIESGLRVVRARVLPELLAFYAGRRYSCAQEVAIILARRGCRVTNDCVTPILYYRSRTRLCDAVTNVLFGARVFLVCAFDWRRDPFRLVRWASECLVQAPPNDASSTTDTSPR